MLEHFGVPEYRRGLAHIKKIAAPQLSALPHLSI